MKYLCILLVLLISLSTASPAVSRLNSKLNSASDTLLKPSGFDIDSLKALAYWKHPQISLLNEGFEQSENLPSGWQSSSEGSSAWVITEDATSLNLYIPGHLKYAASNDFNAGHNNNGCCDRLITPFIDLSLTDSVKLNFNSLYSGAFNEKATVEISLDAGITWHEIIELESSSPYQYSWENITVDLSPYCAYVGASTALLAFHADDQAQQASGWAVDDISVIAYATGLVNYSIWLNNEFLGATANNTWEIDPALLNYAQEYKCEIAANYSFGQSGKDSAFFRNHYLPYPTNLQAMVNISEVVITWNPPDFGTSGLESSLLHFNLYLDDSLYITLPPASTQYHLTSMLGQGEHIFAISAVYDMSELGYPGIQAESAKAYSDIVSYYFCCVLPLIEDWLGGTFSLNNWTAGENWVITPDYGLEPPAAMFTSVPGLVNYVSSLESFARIAHDGTGTPVDVFLEFDLKLNDSLADQKEFLSFLYKEQYNQTWDTIIRFSNQGDTDWQHFKFRLDYPNRFGTITFKMVAHGQNSLSINNWLVDNIFHYNHYSLNPPLNLIAEKVPNTIGIIRLDWMAPVDSVFLKSTAATEDLIYYEIQRLDRLMPSSVWRAIDTVTTTWYLDKNLVSGCYDYRILSMYREGFGLSDVDSLNCITIGLEPLKEIRFLFYPQPASDYLIVEMPEDAKHLRIISNSGTLVFEKASGSLVKEQLDLSTLPQGLYLLQITLGSGRVLCEKLLLSGND
jgi:hypothetical protein